MNKIVKNSLLYLFIGLFCVQPATHCINFNQVKSFLSNPIEACKPYITVENCFKAAVFTGFACFVGYVSYYIWKSNRPANSYKDNPYWSFSYLDPADLVIPESDKKALLSLLNEIKYDGNLKNKSVFTSYMNKLKEYREKPYAQSGSLFLTPLNIFIKALTAYYEEDNLNWCANSLEELKNYLETLATV